MAGAAGCGGVTWAGAYRAGRVCSQRDVRASHRIVPISSPVTDSKMERVFTRAYQVVGSMTSVNPCNILTDRPWTDDSAPQGELLVQAHTAGNGWRQKAPAGRSVQSVM